MDRQSSPTPSTLTVSDWRRVADQLDRIAGEIEQREPDIATIYRRDARRIRITVGRTDA